MALAVTENLKINVVNKTEDELKNSLKKFCDLAERLLEEHFGFPVSLTGYYTLRDGKVKLLIKPDKENFITLSAWQLNELAKHNIIVPHSHEENTKAICDLIGIEVIAV